jgi:phosphoserine phosphatase
MRMKQNAKVGMQRMALKAVLVITTLVALGLTTVVSQAADPLPSWNDGPAKQSIIAFVEKVTNPGAPDFVPVPERIATFDNDGTLWSEQPVPVQFYFVADRVKALAPQHPEWKDKELFASLLKGDLRAALEGGDHGLMELFMATHTGMTTDEFAQMVTDWIATAKHPQTGKRFLDMTYQPMLEVLAYLRANGFKNFIVSGGGIEFMRPWAERAYGIPPEQVIGSSMKTKFELRDGKAVLVRLPALNFNDDKADKPVGINQHIGRRPIAAFGNSVGDQQMLEYAQGGGGARFGVLVLHDDVSREIAYGPARGLPNVKYGYFTSALEELAKKNGWTVVSMKETTGNRCSQSSRTRTPRSTSCSSRTSRCSSIPPLIMRACSRPTRKASLSMRVTVRTSRCSSASSARPTSTRSMPRWPRCSRAPT